MAAAYLYAGGKTSPRLNCRLEIVAELMGSKKMNEWMQSCANWTKPRIGEGPMAVMYKSMGKDAGAEVEFSARVAYGMIMDEKTWEADWAETGV